MSSYLIGNLIGRFIASAFLVWLALLCINKFKVGQSTKKIIRPLPLLSTTMVFILGLIGNAAAETTEKQLFWVTNFPKVGVEEIYIPSNPSWIYEVKLSDQIKTIHLASQAIDDIAAIADLSQHGFRVTQEDYEDVRAAIVKQLGNQLQSQLSAIGSNDNHLQSFRYQATSNLNNNPLSHQYDIFRANNRIWTFSTVVSESNYSEFQILRTKIFNSIVLADDKGSQNGTNAGLGNKL